MSTKIENPDLKKVNQPGHWGTTDDEPKKEPTVKPREGAAAANSSDKAPTNGGEITHREGYKNTPDGLTNPSDKKAYEPTSYPQKAELYDEKQPAKKPNSGEVHEDKPAHTNTPDRNGQVGEQRPESPGKQL